MSTNETVAVKKVPLSAIADQYSALLPVEKELALVGKNAIDIVIATHDGEMAIVKQGHDEVPDVAIVVSAATKEELVAAIAALPNFRQKFAGMVIEKVREFRAGAEYGKMIATLSDLRMKVDAQISKMREATAKAAAPFDVTLFISDNVLTTEAKSTSVVTSRTRQRAPSEVKWNLDNYVLPRLVNGLQIYLSHEGRRWVISTESGEELAEGDSASAATKVWFAGMGKATSVSAPAVWGAAAQEAAAEGG